MISPIYSSFYCIFAVVVCKLVVTFSFFIVCADRSHFQSLNLRSSFLSIMNCMKNFYTEEEQYWMTGGNTGTLPNRITPSKIYILGENEIFVFGSNIKGMHMGGAARAAYNKFGAEWGNGEGLQGKSYALPTMEGLESTKEAVIHFTQCAKAHQELKFYVTPVGCGIAGYTSKEIGPLFKDAAELPNVFLPISFWKVLVGITG